jgi:hypothetical protein
VVQQHSTGPASVANTKYRERTARTETPALFAEITALNVSSTPRKAMTCAGVWFTAGRQGLPARRSFSEPPSRTARRDLCAVPSTDPPLQLRSTPLTGSVGVKEAASPVGSAAADSAADNGSGSGLPTHGRISSTAPAAVRRRRVVPSGGGSRPSPRPTGRPGSSRRTRTPRSDSRGRDPLA